MIRILTAAAAGILVGAVAVALLTRPATSPADAIVRDIVDVPKITAGAAERHRSTRYADIATIEQVLALPTEFAQLEALFVLAGRSDAASVQALIFAANRIADDILREQVLGVLFRRLAEQDARSALALARTDYFHGLPSLEQTVWRAWGRRDLDAALSAAKSQTNGRDRDRAAQSLYVAFGSLGNETTERIEAELGIAPDRGNRARYLYRLADRSPEEAIRYVEGLTDRKRFESVAWLADYLASSEPELAESLASSFDDPRLEQVFSDSVGRKTAEREPRAVLDEVLASGRIGDRQHELVSAMRTLAGKDVDAAMAYFDQLKGTGIRRLAGSAIVEKLAEDDPLRALDWARANEGWGMHRQFEMTALMHIAQENPRLALAEATRAPGLEVRMNLVSNVIDQIASDDIRTAIGMLEQIDDRDTRNMATQSVVSHWIREDADAALDWILSRDDAEAAALVQQASWRLVRSDVDAAVRAMEHLPAQQRAGMQMQIAQQLATGASADEAQAFVRRFEGEANYPQLQATVIAGLAASDPVLARQLADQLADPAARNSAYAAVIGQYARRDPRAAIGMLALIDDEQYRGAATAQVAMHWHQTEPEAATRWVATLPAGTQRDDAVMQMANYWREPTREQQALIDGIENDAKRGQAKLRIVYGFLQTDPERARMLLSDPDIPEMHLRNAGLRF